MTSPAIPSAVLAEDNKPGESQKNRTEKDLKSGGRIHTGHVFHERIPKKLFLLHLTTFFATFTILSKSQRAI